MPEPRMHRFALSLCAVAMLAAGDASAYGPMTHMGEGARYLAAAADVPSLSAEALLISTGEPRLYFDLGTMYPDLREAIDLPFSTHDLGLAQALLAASEGGPAWQRAFARGYAQHVHSDAAAQVFLVPWVVLDNHLGEVDLFDEVSTDHPSGESELYVEAGLDLYQGDVGGLYDVLDSFIFQRRGVDRFMEVFAFYYDVACGLHPAACDGQEAATAQLLGLAEILRGLRLFLPEALVKGIVQRAASQPLGDLLRRWGPLVGLGWDSAEMDRLASAPLFADASWLPDAYRDHFADLGVGFALAWATGGASSPWPVWHAPTLLNTALSSVATLIPQRFVASGALTVFEAGFDVPGGSPLSSLSRSAPPPSVRARARIFALTPWSGAVTVRVKAELGGGYDADPLCGSAAFATDELEVGWGDRATQAPLDLAVTFDPRACLADARALYMEIVEGDEPRGEAMFTGSWEGVQGAPGRDLSQEVYLGMYAPASARPAYIPVVD